MKKKIVLLIFIVIMSLLIAGCEEVRSEDNPEYVTIEATVQGGGIIGWSSVTLNTQEVEDKENLISKKDQMTSYSGPFEIPWGTSIVLFLGADSGFMEAGVANVNGTEFPFGANFYPLVKVKYNTVFHAVLKKQD